MNSITAKAFTDSHCYVMIGTTRSNGNRRWRGRWIPKAPHNQQVAEKILVAMNALRDAGHQGGVEWKALETEYKRFSR